MAKRKETAAAEEEAGDATAFIAAYVRLWAFCTFTRVFFRSGKELVYNSYVAAAVVPSFLLPTQPLALLCGFGVRIFAMLSSLPYLHDSQHWCLQVTRRREPRAAVAPARLESSRRRLASNHPCATERPRLPGRDRRRALGVEVQDAEGPARRPQRRGVGGGRASGGADDQVRVHLLLLRRRLVEVERGEAIVAATAAPALSRPSR